MNRRPLATPRARSNIPSAEAKTSEPPCVNAAEKNWQIDEPSGMPAPVIRANMISFRKSHQGPVKVTFFEQD